MRVYPTLFCVSVQMSSFSDGHVRHSFHAALSTEAAANMVADYVKIQTSKISQHANQNLLPGPTEKAYSILGRSAFFC